MRTLLTFTGSIIYFFVMIIISPLLALVYSGLETVSLYKYVRSQKVFFRPFANWHLPHFRFSIKESIQTAWEKAIHFHF